MLNNHCLNIQGITLAQKWSRANFRVLFLAICWIFPWSNRIKKVQALIKRATLTLSSFPLNLPSETSITERLKHCIPQSYNYWWRDDHYALWETRGPLELRFQILKDLTPSETQALWHFIFSLVEKKYCLLIFKNYRTSCLKKSTFDLFLNGTVLTRLDKTDWMPQSEWFILLFLLYLGKICENLTPLGLLLIRKKHRSYLPVRPCSTVK